MVALALVTLLAMGAFSVDVGQLCVAARRAQDVADAAAFAGGGLLKTPSDAINSAVATVAANNIGAGVWTVTSVYSTNTSTTDILYYAPWSYVPGVGFLGYYAKALRVRAKVTVNFTFARVVGLTTNTITRQAIVVRSPAGGTAIAPMWLYSETDYQYGTSQNLFLGGDETWPGIPGNFGWLDVPPGISISWQDLMAGKIPTDLDRELLFRTIGDLLTAYPGVKIGQWRPGLEYRMDLSATAPWTGQNFDNHTDDNPRIMVIPLVTYMGGNGNNAKYRVDKFGAFWLDSIDTTGMPKKIIGRFIRYTLPGAGIDPAANDASIFTYRLVK
jgi:hypothetical protein